MRLDFLPDAAVEIGVAGRDRVHPDHLRRQLKREALRIVDQRRLDGAVGRAREVDLASRHRRDEARWRDALDFSDNGSAAFTASHACASCRRRTPSARLPHLSWTASAETLATTMSTPPSAFALSAMKPSSAALSATSIAAPKARDALGLQRGDGRGDLVGVAGADRDIRALVGEESPRRCRPIPLLPPVTMAFRPLRPRSMVVSRLRLAEG